MKTILRIVVLETGYAERSQKYWISENSWAIKTNVVQGEREIMR